MANNQSPSSQQILDALTRKMPHSGQDQDAPATTLTQGDVVKRLDKIRGLLWPLFRLVLIKKEEPQREAVATPKNFSR